MDPSVVAFHERPLVSFILKDNLAGHGDLSWWLLSFRS